MRRNEGVYKRSAFYQNDWEVGTVYVDDDIIELELENSRELGGLVSLSTVRQWYENVEYGSYKVIDA